MIAYGIAEQLRYRVVVATLTRKPIVITNIREDDENPGLRGKILFCKVIFKIMKLTS